MKFACYWNFVSFVKLFFTYLLYVIDVVQNCVSGMYKLFNLRGEMHFEHAPQCYQFE